MKLNGDAPAVLFPIEIGTREFDSKLVMASALAARGCRAIVGHKEAIKLIARSSKNVVWQGKSLFDAKARDETVDQLLNNESPVMFIHDEGAIWQVSIWEQSLLKNHHPDKFRIKNISRLCVWGQRQKDVLTSYAAELDKVLTVTGTPRFDICAPKYSWLTSKEELKQISGPYILACSRFQMAAHAEGQGDPFHRRIKVQSWPDGFDLKKITDVIFSDWHRAVHDFADFVVLIKEMAHSYPDRAIVVRPHPSENQTFYEQAFSSFDNVIVTRQGSVLDWIRSAELVVHSNCTTGIEAMLAERPVLNLLPASNTTEGTNKEVACEAGVTAYSIEDALEKAGKLLNGKTPPHTWSSRAESILNNLKSEAVPLLSEQTLAVVSENNLESSKVVLPQTHGLKKMASSAISLFREGRAGSYAASKRGNLPSAQYVEMAIDGFRSMGVGGGRLRHVTEQFIVIDP